MRENKSAVFCLLVGIGAFLSDGAVLAQAGGPQASEPPEFLKKIIDYGDLGRPKLGKGYGARLNAGQREDVSGIYISIFPEYLGDKCPEYRGEGNAVSIDYFANEKKIIAAFGLLYRVTSAKENHCTIEWIPAKEAPNGLTARADSIFVPFRRINYGGAAFGGAGVGFVGVGEAADEKKASMPAKLTVHVSSTLDKRGATWKATVKTGDVVLINENGYKVRAVVPPDEKTRVYGWVELDAKPIPRANLVRDRMPFVEPELERKAGPAVQHIRMRRHWDGPLGYFSVVAIEDPSKPDGVVVVSLPRYTIHFPRFDNGDIVALAGSLYRYSVPPKEVDMPPKDTVLRWIEDWQLPNYGLPRGTALPSDGSMFVPLQKKGVGGIVITRDLLAPVASLCFLRHEKKGDKKEIVATLVSGKGDDNLTPTSLEFVVKTGDYVLVADKGYQVRAIVPDIGVRGWVELDANGIPIADLIRNKTPFVRPMPKEGQPK